MQNSAILSFDRSNSRRTANARPGLFQDAIDVFTTAAGDGVPLELFARGGKELVVVEKPQKRRRGELQHFFH